ncbi:MAG: MOSC domain-containing protein [Nitrospiraceae bacterium]
MKLNSSYLHQINVSAGGVPKHAVPEARITVEGVSGDCQRNRRIHGGRDRAVCLYSMELIEMLRGEGHGITAGSTGENLTIAGVEWAAILPGDVLMIGAVRLEILSYTSPCRFNAQWFLHGDYMRISQQRYPGWSRLYARVLEEGLVRQGDSVLVISKSGSLAGSEKKLF